MSGENVQLARGIGRSVVVSDRERRHVIAPVLDVIADEKALDSQLRVAVMFTCATRVCALSEDTGLARAARVLVLRSFLDVLPSIGTKDAGGFPPGPLSTCV